MKHVLLYIGIFVAFASTVSCYASDKTIVRDEFTVEYRDAVPDAAAEMVADRVENALSQVREYLAQSSTYAGPPYDEAMKVVIDPDRFGPYQLGAGIYLPEARVLNLFNEVEDARVDLGIIHEVTHVLAESFGRKNRDRFYDDGLAVYFQHRFGDLPNYPDFGEDLYVAVARLAVEYGGLVPLADAEMVRLIVIVRPGESSLTFKRARLPDS